MTFLFYTAKEVMRSATFITQLVVSVLIVCGGFLCFIFFLSIVGQIGEINELPIILLAGGVL